MALAAYQTALDNLLQTPSQPIPLIAAGQKTVFINQARQHVAGEAECVRVYGALPLVTGQRSYGFPAITVGGTAATTGVGGVNNIRTLWYAVPGTSGQLWVIPREFEWFSLYSLNNAVPLSGPPKEWSQLGQGQNGTIFVDPLPDGPYSCPLDLVGAPIPLIDDATVEAIPPLWQDAVPFYAAWLAFLNLLRPADAEAMIQRYAQLMTRARTVATASVLPDMYAQGPDPMLANRLGLAPRQQAGGAS